MSLSKKKIVLVEFHEEVDEFLSFCKKSGIDAEDYNIIALMPEVQVYLTNLNLRYENTLPYFSNESHQRLLLKSEEWIQLLSEKIDISDGTEVTYTYNNTFLFYIRFFMHHFLICVELLSSITKDNDVEAIYAFIHNETPQNSTPLLTDDECYLGKIAEMFCEAKGIAFNGIFMPSVESEKKNKYKGLRRSGISKLFFELYRKLLMKYLAKKKSIIITSTGYNLDKVALQLKEVLPDVELVWLCSSEEDLAKHFFKSLISRRDKSKIKAFLVESGRLNGYNISSNFSKLQSRFNSYVEKIKTEWRKSFEYKDVNFIDMFIDKVVFGLGAKMNDLFSQSNSLREILKDGSIRLVISPFARETALLTAEMANHADVPCLIISHGTLSKPKNRLEEIECLHLGESLIISKYYNNVALQTPNEEKVFSYFGCKSRHTRTGPLIFSKTEPSQKEAFSKEILGSFDSGQKILLYPENTRLRYNARFHVFESFDEFLSSCIDLVNAVEEIDDVHLIIRLHPGKKISETEFKKLLPVSEKLTVTSFNQPFYKVLTITDLLINFSSTVIEDALQNYIPVLLYDKWNRYMHFEAQELTFKNNKKTNAIYYINDSLYLRQGIKWIIDNHLSKNIDTSIFNDYVYDIKQRDDFIRFISDEVFQK